ncbi:MAG: DUF2807 domain-containing protein [Caulobacter sp.]|nr:DUF2807 domain-containing protein [Caulobacter sp.]
MIRNLTIVAVASFVLCMGCLAGAAALGGRELIQHGWSIPSNWRVDIDDDNDHIHIGPGSTTDESEDTSQTERQLAWSGGSSLQVDLPANVTYTQAAAGAAPSVKISGPRALVDRVVIEDGQLRLKEGSGRGVLRIGGHGFDISRDTDRLEIEVSAPAVRDFTVNGSGDLHLKGYDQPDLVLAINGSGDVEAEGRTKRLELRVSGSGDADASSLETGDAQVEISGSGSAKVAPKGLARIDVAGSGEVSLTSKPSNLETNVAGSGEVRQDW